MPDHFGSKLLAFPVFGGSPVSGLSDEDLVRRIREEGEECTGPWDELIRRYYSTAWHFARGRVGDCDLALDIVQAAFLRAVRALDSFDANRSFASWFYTIVRNLCADAKRERFRQQTMLEGLAKASSSQAASSPAQARETGDLDALLAALSTDEREALICRHLHGMTAGEAGRVLGVSAEAAKKRAQRALDKLRQFVSRNEAICRIS